MNSDDFVKDMNSADFAKKYLPAAAVAGVGLTVATAPAFADGPTVPSAGDVTTAINATGAVAVAATTIVLGVMGVRMAIKLVNRISAKG